MIAAYATQRRRDQPRRSFLQEPTRGTVRAHCAGELLAELLGVLGMELLVLFALPLLVPYSSLVPPLLQPAINNAAAAPKTNITFFIITPFVNSL